MCNAAEGGSKFFPVILLAFVRKPFEFCSSFFPLNEVLLAQGYPEYLWNRSLLSLIFL